MKRLAEEFRLRLLPISLAQAVGIGCGVIGVRLGSHWVEPADLGRYGVFLTLTPIGMGVVFAGLNKFVTRLWAGTAGRGALLRAAARAGARRLPWLAALAAVLTLFAAPPQPLFFGAAVLLAAAALTVTQITQAALQADRRHWRDCGFAAAASLTRTFLPLSAYVLAGATVEWLIGGFVAHSLLLALLSLAWLHRPWQAPGPATGPELAPAFGGPLFTVLAVAGWGLAGLTRWLAAGFYGAEAAGYVTLAANIAGIIPSVLGTMLMQYLQPGWFALGDAGAPPAHLRRETDRAALGYALGALGLTFILHLAMPVLIGPLVSGRYAATTGLILPLGCFATAIMTGAFFHALLLATRREQACGPADLSGAAVLVTGALAGAWLGWDWFLGWLLVSPLVPWLVNRPLAHRALLRTDAARGPAAGP